MTAYNSALLEDISENATTIVSDLRSLEKEPISFSGTDYLEKPNRDNDSRANQTFSDHFNGESSQFDFRLRSWLANPTFPQRAWEYFDVQQKWEGYVVEVQQDVFVARLVPIIGEGTDLEAEIFTQEVDVDDQVLIEPGAVFYWSIGYLRKPSGTIRASLIRFRRSLSLTKRELEIAQAKATELAALFNDDNSTYTTSPE